MHNLVTSTLNALLNNKVWKEKKAFIGYGNPDARILIIGKECAYRQGDDGYRNEYVRNFDMWQNHDKNKTYDSVNTWVERDTCDWSIFDPIAPFKGQYFKCRRTKTDEQDRITYDNFGTSKTWYNYQKLINFYRDMHKGCYLPNQTRIDFFKDCFITELSEICRPNNKRLNVMQRKEVEDNIRERFDLMRETSSFWSHFDTVVLACGPYSKALRERPELRTSIFGNAKVLMEALGKPIPQLSYAISDELLMEIARMMS